jgi:hypothetical protein
MSLSIVFGTPITFTPARMNGCAPDIVPSPPMATIAKSQRDKLGAAQRTKVEEHERRRDRAARELVDAEKDLTAARADLAKAEAVLVDIRKRILNV